MFLPTLVLIAALQAQPASPPAGVGVVIRETDTMVRQVPPHSGQGMSTAYRISDGVPNRAMEFRKRVMHPGAAIGLHPIAHDEVYYVVSGEGEVTSDGVTTQMRAGDAAYLFDGNVVGIRQTGEVDLVLIISYPLAQRKN
ncbi:MULTISPECIES: cupin domain-containing protein [unclassified Brevundimonas]|uniref:cupin domain-containing protein n=2 Tax=Brevundimonas TaxID=41275 RepID=UPI000CFD4A04|nr:MULTISPECIES: cupin domain-containing protein [unclassified Brevundimonas]PRA26300.1 cupin [Brevundimonas sp. MYb27]PQZ80626.1 cupin [Brevundimonas sp. MYb31]PRB16908.1 cupin [Brevundimonas sp. MYb52]PRB37377.1 cupin [Brevundimonas sp. MYb46]PRB54881.1 cupin [Brevundimonas sp. MYb33]